MALNLTCPTQFTGEVVAETVATTGSSNDSIDPGLTKSGGLPIAAIVEHRSTNGMYCAPRLTNAQIAAILANANVSTVAGMSCFNSDWGTFVSKTGANTVFTSVPQVATKTLTSAQLLALSVTPVTLIAAPGANSMIVVERITLEFVVNTIAYTVPGGALFTFGINGVLVTTSASSAAAGLVDQAVNTTLLTPGVLIAATASATLANQALSITNTIGALTAGNGTLRVHVWYSVITV